MFSTISRLPCNRAWFGGIGCVGAADVGCAFLAGLRLVRLDVWVDRAFSDSNLSIDEGGFGYGVSATASTICRLCSFSGVLCSSPLCGPLGSVGLLNSVLVVALGAWFHHPTGVHIDGRSAYARITVATVDELIEFIRHLSNPMTWATRATPDMRCNPTRATARAGSALLRAVGAVSGAGSAHRPHP